MDDKVYTEDVYLAIEAAEDSVWRHIIGVYIVGFMYLCAVGITASIWFCDECSKQEGVEFFYKLSNWIANY